MKNILSFVILVCMTLPLTAQVVYDDSIHHVSATVYAGTLAGPKLSLDSGSVTSFFSLRAGGTITWTPNKWLTLFGLGGGEIDQTRAVTPFTLFGVRLRPITTVVISLGKMPSPMTELTPLPTTGPGQFEPWTQTHILGSAIGGKITYAPSKRFSVVAGNFWREKQASLELGMKIGPVRMAGYYLNQSENFGGALDVKYKNFSSTFSYNPENVALFTLVGLPGAENISIYSDVGYDPSDWKLLRGEWGCIKNTSINKLQVLLGIGYSEEIHSIKGYVFIHL